MLSRGLAGFGCCVLTSMQTSMQLTVQVDTAVRTRATGENIWIMVMTLLIITRTSNCKLSR